MANKATDSLVEDFYSSLILLGLLNPLKSVKRPQAYLQAEGNPTVNPWHCFLDDLSFLLDYQSGGKTVTSIAAENHKGSPIFWVSTTQSDARKSLDHMKWILGLLRDIRLEEAERLAFRISKASVAMSNNKVKNYRNIMTKVMEKAIPPTDQPISALDVILFRDLKRLIEGPQDAYELCKLAYYFRYAASMKHLKDKSKGTSKPELWSLIRHCIGRLGFWLKASKRIVEYCQNRPFLLTEFRIKRCPTVLATTAFGVKTTLRDVLRRMLPDYDDIDVVQTLERIRAPGSASVSQRYASMNSAARFRPRMHAEVALLEHFYSSDLRYFGDDKYIGCSKASCYCCNLYFQYHPAGLEPRPCHENVWCQWLIPISTFRGVQSLLGKAIIPRMMDSMMTDLRSYVIAGPSCTIRPPDSTTEISSRSSYSRI